MIDPQMYTWVEGHGLVLRLRARAKGADDDKVYWWSAVFEAPNGIPTIRFADKLESPLTTWHELVGHSLEPTQAVCELLRLTSGQYLVYAGGLVKVPTWRLTSTQESVG